MNQEIVYLIFVLFELLIVGSIAIYMVSLLYSSFMGAPYFPSRQKDLEESLAVAHLKSKSIFLELGCGDGRVTRTAVKEYQVIGIGIDINQVLIMLSKLLAQKQKLNNATFIRKNIFEYNFSHANVIYMFLMPELIRKLLPKFAKEARKDALVISHGFKVPTWEKYLVDTINRKTFCTYFYRPSFNKK